MSTLRQDEHKAIGIFDSGVGGLTVLKALMTRLPNEHTVYLGDTARVPYGTKSAEVVTQYSLKNAEFLVAQHIKLLVVACNTASAVALPALTAALPIPVIGVIEPGAAAAALKSHSGRIAVIGTPGTIRSGAYQRALSLARPGVQVRAKACPMLVPLAEEGWTSGEVPTLIAREYLNEFLGDSIDTLVLGCTHYPLLEEVIASVLGPDVALIDSAEATSEVVARKLELEGGLRRGTQAVTRRYFVTDVPERFAEVGARFLGAKISAVEQIDLHFTS